MVKLNIKITKQKSGPQTTLLKKIFEIYYIIAQNKKISKQ
jgi:hypothetical protein